MPEFQLHPTLADDTIEVARWPLCRVLLMNDSRYPWLILVPARAAMKEIHDLDAADQSLLMSEIDRASRVLSDLFTPDKINVGALGNIVQQLHIHVVARFETDDSWPGPVWGAHQPLPNEPAVLEILAERIKPALS
jgi:diadenosine tetraphosphate (Ap4A) HIT family hydrolase